MQTIFRRIGVATVLACALAPASAQAAPGCGGTITASTTLRADLTGCPGDGLVIGADNLTLDLGRHTIAGTGTAGSAGIRLAGHHGVTIRNGIVEDFATGVALSEADRNRLQRLTLRDNARRAVDVTGSDGNVLDALSASGGRTGVVLTDAGGNVVRGSTFRGNPITGVLVVASARNRVERNVVDGSSNGVAVVGGSERNAVIANAISHADSGVDLDEASHNAVAANRLKQNGDGILLSSGDENTIALNLVDTTFPECQTGPCGRGIAVDGGNGNTVKANAVRGAATDGIAVAAAASDTRLALNLAAGAGDDGIDADSAATTLWANLALANHDLGIEAVPGVTDRGGNRAARNGNPAQCSVVSCAGGHRRQRR
jgi:parallel beta-helix repeat protein